MAGVVTETPTQRIDPAEAERGRKPGAQRGDGLRQQFYRKVIRWRAIVGQEGERDVREEEEEPAG